MSRNNVKHLNFSSSYITAIAVEDVRDYPIGENPTIVVNPHMKDARINEPGQVIPPFSSTILKNTQIKEAKSLVLLEIKEIRKCCGTEMTAALLPEVARPVSLRLFSFLELIEEEPWRVGAGRRRRLEGTEAGCGACAVGRDTRLRGESGDEPSGRGAPPHLLSAHSVPRPAQIRQALTRPSPPHQRPAAIFSVALASYFGG